MVEIGGGLLVWFFARFVGEGAMRELVYCGSSPVALIMKEVLLLVARVARVVVCWCHQQRRAS